MEKLEMALRLRKDVQKASYYVWFLGAEEARGLRGPRVLLPAIPRLIERSREQEPLKVTLQVSHKGMKILQGSSKHFIANSAITCSVQTDDIVACVLLLYNPTTKCPLHVHAYRCDSETTAQALHQFLQVLINRPENQKRFAELEQRLGSPESSVAMPTQRSTPPVRITESQHKKRSNGAETTTTTTSPSKLFESSISSDTGTSTRESECSEELNQPISSPTPISPVKATLYDSLAAELRAKLNGNGPPLLLPPRDYDTVHRSKGNLAAIELRRCRNSSIVGGGFGPAEGGLPKKVDTSRSRGSSGIGSDLAPSPDQNDANSSSDDEWINASKPIPPITHSPKRPVSQKQQQQQHQQPAFRTYSKEKSYKSLDDVAQQPPLYLYPRDSPKSLNKKQSDQSNQLFDQRFTTREDDPNSYYCEEREEEIKPIIHRPKTFNFRFKDIVDEVMEKEKLTNDERHRNHSGDKDHNNPMKKIYRQNSSDRRKDDHHDHDHDHDFVKERDAHHRYSSHQHHHHHEQKRIFEKEIIDVDKDKENFSAKENLTDRQKISYRQKEQSSQEENTDREYYIPKPISRDVTDNMNQMKTSNKSTKYKYENCREKIVQSQNEARDDIPQRHSDKNQSRSYHDRSYIDYDRNVDRNPYHEPSSLPYRESIEKMMKSPIMKYKSFDGQSPSGSLPDDEQHSSMKYINHSKMRDQSVGRIREQMRSIEIQPKYDQNEQQVISRRRIIEKQRSISPPETILRISPKDRFQGAKEKFQAMERDNMQAIIVEMPMKSSKPPLQRSHPHSSNRSGSAGGPELTRHSSIEHNTPQYIPQNHSNDRDMEEWSSDDERFRSSSKRQMTAAAAAAIGQRYSERIEISPSRMIQSAKSLGNLVRGHRHSYAEPPRNPLPRNSGRVGLAAVNPY